MERVGAFLLCAANLVGNEGAKPLMEQAEINSEKVCRAALQVGEVLRIFGRKRHAGGLPSQKIYDNSQALSLRPSLNRFI